MTYSLAAILVITPLFGFILYELPFKLDFKVGMAVFAAVPTTLTSGVTLVLQAGGNGALAIMLTVCTNVIGIGTTPGWLKAIVRGSDASIDAAKILIKLLLTILVPLCLGKGLRESSQKVQNFVKNHKVSVGLTNNALLIMIVWMTISSGASNIIDQSAGTVILVILTEIIVHGCYLTLNFGATNALQLPKQEFRAVLLLASQKTLPVAATIITYLEMEGLNAGLMTLPCIMGHISQLLIDSGIVSYWLHKDEKEKQTGGDAGDAGGAGATIDHVAVKL